jgi:hypothetical protein
MKVCSIFMEMQTMINAGFVDFLFTGAAILPQILLFTGYIGPALLLFIPLLIAACLISMYREQTSKVAEIGEESGAEMELPLTTVER